MTQRILVTAALPYANGKLHLGHLVEYLQADIYVRALKKLGKNAIYICATDAHGTPIEINAKQHNMAPEAFVKRVHDDFVHDFGLFDVAFDFFSSTHSDTNKALVQQVYQQLQATKHVIEREVDGNYCEHDKRFLPDRFIKGICPRCNHADQYGDVCEKCGATYPSTELKEPFCVLCGRAPVIKQSTHTFFQLSSPKFVSFLRSWIDSGVLQKDVANYVRHWLDSGLKDWCISRDGPYFGFEIPGRPGKYFYVWLDAPFGYFATAIDWAHAHNVDPDELLKSNKTRIEHFIGKDIMYFHTLFWPAILHALGYNLPSRIYVHGMLTVNGEKMSKSRGTSVQAATFAQHVDPQALRFYYASKFSYESSDIDFSIHDFTQRINGELVNKHVNLFSRVCQFVVQKLNGNLGDLPFSPKDAQSAPTDTPEAANHMLHLAQHVVQLARNIETCYQKRDIAQVVRDLGRMADIGNEYMQNQKPWEQLKISQELARTTCTFVINICHAMAMYMWPITPKLSQKATNMLRSAIDSMDASLLFAERSRSIGALQRLFERLEQTEVDKIMPAIDTPEPPKPSTPSIDIDLFKKMDLRIGCILQAEAVPKSKKLLRLQVDLGEPKPRQIISGLALHYTPEALLGKRVVVVANLQEATIMACKSQGMILAGEHDGTVVVLHASEQLPPGSQVR